MKHNKNIWISKEELEKINRYLNVEPKNNEECLSEDEIFSKTATFPNGIEIDIKCCGVQYEEGESNLAWTEGILFDNGVQVSCTDPGSTFEGEWSFEYGDDSYIVYVKTIGNDMRELQELIEEMDWSISDCSFSNDVPGWEISQHSPAGEDFSFAIEHDNDSQKAIREIRNYAFRFDIEEHVNMWLKAKDNVSGVPDVVTLVNDAKAISKMLNDLYDHIVGTDSGVPDVNAPCLQKMTAGVIKQLLQDIPNETPIFVACQGYCNYDFKENHRTADTHVIVRDGKIFITDECAVDDGKEGTL